MDDPELLRAIAVRLRKGHAPSNRQTGWVWRVPPQGPGTTTYEEMTPDEVAFFTEVPE